MVRGRKARTWVKLDCEGVLRGSINYLLTLEGQAIWVKMIALSEVCGGRPGFIEDNNQNGLPFIYIAHELHCTVEQFENVLDSMKNDGAIHVNGTGSIQLVNFHHYQFGEYDRQLPYREKKKQAELDANKKPYGEFSNVMLADKEYEKLVVRFGEIKTKAKIETLSAGVESKGYKYNSHYAAILTWDRMDESRKPKKDGVLEPHQYTRAEDA